MHVQQPKAPLSSAYLNLLQSRPVAAVPRVAERGAAAEKGEAGARPAGAAAPPPTRGRLLDILA